MPVNNHLQELEARSIYIIREAYWEHRDKLAILWSMGKDSTVLVHLARKAFLGKIPIKVLHIDTTFKFKEIYDFRDKYAKLWNLKLIVSKNITALKKRVSPEGGKFECCNLLKTEALKQAIAKFGFRALLVGIRRDEHLIRAKERYFSLRDKDFIWDYHNQPIELWGQYYKSIPEKEHHLRIHPLLHWQEQDVWNYIKMEKLPVVGLYFAKERRRYRSIGCECCCEPVESTAKTIDKVIKELKTTKVAERAGRAQDKEQDYTMQKLRSLGYM